MDFLTYSNELYMQLLNGASILSSLPRRVILTDTRKSILSTELRTKNFFVQPDLTVVGLLFEKEPRHRTIRVRTWKVGVGSILD
jgi:hypothetical protein